MTVGTTQVAIPHGLGSTPTVVIVTMTSSGSIYQSASADGTNIYLTATSASQTADVYVGFSASTPTPTGSSASSETLVSTTPYGATFTPAIIPVSTPIGKVGTSQQFVNVMTYGAKGNGVADDTMAIQSAINAVSSTGGVVYFPAGSYNLSSGLVLDYPGVTLEGAGMSTSTLLAPLSTTANALDIGAANVTITNLGINGRYTQQSAPTGQGQEGVFLATGSVNDTISNCWIYNTVGSGVINVGGTAGSNLTVQGCDITNLGTAFSLAVGTPTTTSIAVRTGQGALFSVGQTVHVAASSTIRSATTTSITVTAGTGATFVAGQALNVAGTTVTVSSITGDTLNLASALSSAPAAGQTVYQCQSSTVTAISGDTLTVALGYAPQAGDIVSSAGAYGAINGIFLGGSVQGANILNNYIAGWSQAIGLWYGVQNTLVEGNTIIDNYAYQNQSFSIPRSAIELYPNTDVGGNNRVLNNVVDGALHCCIEVAQGEVGTLVSGNTLLHAGGGGAYVSNPLMLVQGQAGTPGADTDITVQNNEFIGTGSANDFALSIGDSTQGIKVSDNTFKDFTNASSYGIYVQGLSTGAPQIIGNSFDNFGGKAIFVSCQGSSLPLGGMISNNSFTMLAGSYSIFLQEAGNDWLIEDNTINGGVRGIFVEGQGGNQDSITGNQIQGTSDSPVYLSTSDNLVENNVLTAGPGVYGAVRCEGTGAQSNLIENNVLSAASNLYAFWAGTGADYNVLQNNLILSGSVKQSVSGTHNVLGPNNTATSAQTTGLVSLGQVTVGTTQVAIPHGLGSTPTVVIITMTSSGSIYQSAARTEPISI